VSRREFVTALTAKAFDRELHAFQEFDRDRVDGALGVTARAETLELAPPPLVDQGLGNNAARGIADAQKQAGYRGGRP